jgi:hypothetical protein
VNPMEDDHWTAYRRPVHFVDGFASGVKEEAFFG